MFKCVVCDYQVEVGKRTDGVHCNSCGGRLIPSNFHLSLAAMDNETHEVFVVTSVHFPLGKPSGKDVAIISKEDAQLTEWRSINEVSLLWTSPPN